VNLVGLLTKSSPGFIPGLIDWFVVFYVKNMPATAEVATSQSTSDTTQLKGCVSVIVPIYNEIDHFDELLRQVHDSPVRKEIIVVDDGSTDGTRERLMEMGLSEDVTLIFHEQNCGKGAAIRTGLRYARGEYILIQDSDLEYDPQDYPALLGPLQEGKANVVYGVRPDRPERGLRFFLGAKLLTHLTNLLYGSGIHDEATCYKVFRRSVLQQLKLECRRFEFCPEVTAKLSRLGERIAEVPINYNPRSTDEGKKIRHVDGWLAIWTLIRLRFTLRRRFVMPEEEPESPFPVGFFRAPSI
jgi:dolichol-phosphate mannosyltransferase